MSRHRKIQRRSRHHHHQHGGSRNRREDLSVDLLQPQAHRGRGGGADPVRAPDAGAGNAHRARHSLQGQFGDDPRRQRRASDRGQQGREGARRLPAQHHAADFRPGARHGLWPHGPARPERAGAEGAPGRLRRRRQHDAPLPPVPRRRRGPAGRGPLRGIHHGKNHGHGGQLRSRSREKPIRTRSNWSASPRSKRKKRSCKAYPARTATSRCWPPSPPRATA